MYNSAFARRQAFWSNSRGRYIQTSLGSRESIESDDDCDNSSVSAISTKSTKSLKSYKSWRRAQRQTRRKLKRAQTTNNLFNESSTVQAMDLSGRRGGSSTAKRKQDVFLSEGDKLSAPVDAVGSNVDSQEELPTIVQSPLVPYYSSSSLNSSSNDSDETSTSPRSLPQSHSEIDEVEDQKNLRSLRKPLFKGKDPLKRRSYPFITPDPPTEVENQQNSYNYLAQTTIKSPETERRRASADEIEGLNAISFLGISKKPSLLELSKAKKKPQRMDEEPYNNASPCEREVVCTETNGFTITLPANSPTVPAHWLVDDNQQLSTRTDDGAPINEDSGECERIQKTVELSNEKGKGWEKKISSREAFERAPDNKDAEKLLKQHQAFETDPGMYFLPPLIVNAMKNKQSNLEKLENNKTHEKNADNTKNARPHLASSSTEEESEDENVYLENTEALFQDFQEKDFLATATMAKPESDTSSIATRESIDPIEDILTRENDVSADKRTFTLNGRAVVMPPTKNTITEETIEITTVSKEESTSPVKTGSTPTIVIEGEMAETKDPKKLNVACVHSHKVGKSKNCPVCKKRERDRKEQEATTESEGVIVEKNITATITAAEEAILKSNTKPRNVSVYSHRVGEDSKCEVCSPNGNSGVAMPELCCAIL